MPHVRCGCQSSDASFTAAPISCDQWMYFTSGVSAPADLFASEGPTLIAIWKSHRINPAVFTDRRLDNAMKNRQEVARNISSAAAERARILHAVTEGWDQYIRGIDTIENTGTGRRYEVSNRSAQDVVDALNKTGGDHWQDFQMDQLVPR